MMTADRTTLARLPARLLAMLLAVTAAMPAAAADLSVQKSIMVVTDPIGTLRPRIFTGSAIDYALIVTNPLANLLTPVRDVRIEDAIDPTVKLRITAYPGAAGGPVEFMDGNLLDLGLLGSGLAYSFVAIGSTTDGLEFFDGTSWAYVPTADAEGCDPRVRRVRIRLTGTQTAGGSFRLRYRVRVQ